MAASGKKRRNRIILAKTNVPVPTKSCEPRPTVPKIPSPDAIEYNDSFCEEKKKGNHQRKPSFLSPISHQNPTYCYPSDFKFQHFTHLTLPTSTAASGEKGKKQNHISKKPRYPIQQGSEIRPTDTHPTSVCTNLLTWCYWIQYDSFMWMRIKRKKNKIRNHWPKPNVPFLRSQRNQTNSYPSNITVQQFTHLMLLNTIWQLSEKEKKKGGIISQNPTFCFQKATKTRPTLPIRLQVPTLHSPDASKLNGCFRRKREETESY